MKQAGTKLKRTYMHMDRHFYKLSTTAFQKPLADNLNLSQGAGGHISQSKMAFPPQSRSMIFSE